MLATRAASERLSITKKSVLIPGMRASSRKRKERSVLRTLKSRLGRPPLVQRNPRRSTRAAAFTTGKFQPTPGQESNIKRVPFPSSISLARKRAATAARRAVAVTKTSTPTLALPSGEENTVESHLMLRARQSIRKGARKSPVTTIVLLMFSALSSVLLSRLLLFSLR